MATVLVMGRADGTCSRCGRFRDGAHKSYCKDCLAAYYKAKRHVDEETWENHKRYNREWNSANPSKRAKYRRKSLLKNTYGLTVGEFDALLENQNNRCPICLEHIEHDARTGMAAVTIDHDHDTNEVRGLLCGTCNAAIGLLNEDVATVARALDYLAAAGEAGYHERLRQSLLR